MSFARPMPLGAAHCLPSPISAIEARLPTSALCRHCANSRVPLICSSPLSRALKRCSPCQDHDQCSACFKADFRTASSARPTRLLPLRLFCFLVSAAPNCRMSFRFARARRTACLHAPPKGIHKVHDVCRLGPLRPRHRLAFLFLLQHLLECILILVLKLAGVKVPRFGFHDMRCKVEHVLRNFLVGNVVKIIGFVSYLIGISQRYAEQSLTACLKRNDVLA